MATAEPDPFSHFWVSVHRLIQLVECAPNDIAADLELVIDDALIQHLVALFDGFIDNSFSEDAWINMVPLLKQGGGKRKRKPSKGKKKPQKGGAPTSTKFAFLVDLLSLVFVAFVYYLAYHEYNAKCYVKPLDDYGYLPIVGGVINRIREAYYYDKMINRRTNSLCVNIEFISNSFTNYLDDLIEYWYIVLAYKIFMVVFDITMTPNPNPNPNPNQNPNPRTSPIPSTSTYNTTRRNYMTAPAMVPVNSTSPIKQSNVECALKNLKLIRGGSHILVGAAMGNLAKVTMMTEFFIFLVNFYVHTFRPNMAAHLKAQVDVLLIPANSIRGIMYQKLLDAQSATRRFKLSFKRKDGPNASPK